MNDSTKYCLTAIIITLVWFLSTPMSGTISAEASLNNIAFLNLTDSTISGQAEMTGSMPIGMVLILFIIESLSYITIDTIFVILMILISITILALILVIYKKYQEELIWEK